MIISHKLKFVFLGIPRTANRAMHKSLKRLPGAYRPRGGLHRMCIPAQATSYFTFCCVRNPYRRLYSHYCCCWGKKRRWWGQRPAKISFADYLGLLADQTLCGSCSGSPHRPNIHAYTLSNRLDAVIRYEELPSAFNTLGEIPGIESLTLSHKGQCLGNDWQSHYTQSIADRVYELAEEDFLEFGYDRDSWLVRPNHQLEPSRP